MKFIALLIAAASAIKVTNDEPWDKDSLPACPTAPRTIMDDGKTHVTKYPYVGATCQLQIGEVNLIMLGSEGAPAPKTAAGMEHCPDFVERHTLVNGTTRAVAYPAAGFNCNSDSL